MRPDVCIFPIRPEVYKEGSVDDGAKAAKWAHKENNWCTKFEF